MNHQRSGYTLFELVLVMAILVALAAFAYPSVETMYGDYRVTAAVDAVRAAWAQGRARSLNEGVSYRFAVAYSQGHFRLAPDGSNWWTGNDSENQPIDDGAPTPLVLEQRLPAGVRFFAADAPVDHGSEAVPTDDDVPPQAWSKVVTFLPDGTASADVELVFRARGARPLVLTLRGFTSVVTVKRAQ